MRPWFLSLPWFPPPACITGLRWVCLAIVAACFALACSGQTAPVESNAALFRGEPLRAVGYTFPDNSWPNTLPPLCAIARDLPLIQALGANTIYTKGAPPEEGDHIFLSVLASTRLNWVAAYPLPKEVDPNRSLMSQKDAILGRFRSFAERFRGNPNLRAIVLDFGTQHLVESALLANEFAAILHATYPENAPQLGHVAYESEMLFYTPAGIEFWLYRFTGEPPAAADRALVQNRTGLPVFFDLSRVAASFASDTSGRDWSDFAAEFAAGTPVPALLAIEYLGERQAVSSTTTASDAGATTTFTITQYSQDALFAGLRDEEFFENLSPTKLGLQLRTFWGAAPLEDHAAAPTLSEVLNAATGTQYLSPGTRVRLSGNLLSAAGATFASSEWPLHAAAKCLCVGDRPVPIEALEASEASAQLPWIMPRGVVPVRFVREGVSSRPVLVDVLETSPGLYPRKIERPDAGCSLDDSDGVRPGETIRLEATGTGPLNGDLDEIEVFLDETPAQVVYAGLKAESVGMAELLVKVPETVTPGERQGLFLRRGNRASNLIPVNFIGNARPTVGLIAARERILVQPGAISAPLEIQTRGLNGYCGTVEFAMDALPKGLSAQISSVQAGSSATLRIQADSFTELSEDITVYLHALPTPGDLATLALKVRVMPRVGEMTLAMESRGYSAGASASIVWNGELLPSTGPKAARGLYLLVIDPRTGIFYPVEHYDLWAGKDESTRLEVRLNSLRTGTIVAMAIADEATHQMQPSLRNWIATKLGSAAIGTLGYQHSWAIVGKTGSAKPVAEATSAGAAASVEVKLKLPE